jgi:LacI family transcriptional regulator, gluconate utilization system Gnt-I transcriptional repressor
VFFAGDVLAAGALFECRRRGWAVPRTEIGRRAAQMLLARLDGKPLEQAVVDVGFELKVRAST